MKLILIPILLLSSIVLAQKMPTKAEMEKLMKQAKEMEKAMGNDATIQQAMKMAAETGGDEVEWGKLPVKDEKRLLALPKTVLSETELKNFIGEIRKKLSGKADQKILEQVKKIILEAGNDPVLMSRSAVASWYGKNGMLSLLLAANAAQTGSSNFEVLNSFSALLNLSNNQHKAIPLLMYLDNKLPGNGTILNNLGQAFLGLGDLAEAEKYLLLCVKKNPTHVEANKSLAILYKQKGNLVKAKSCFLQSLKGGYSETASNGAMLTGATEEEVEVNLLRTHPKNEYFNPYKYDLPPYCDKVDVAKERKDQLNHFTEFIAALKEQYIQLNKQEEEKQKQKINALMANAKKGKGFQRSPLSKLGDKMYGYWLQKYGEFQTTEYAPDLIRYAREHEKLKEEYWDKYGKANSSNAECQQLDIITNEYLSKSAYLQKDLIDRVLTPSRGYAEELIYWSGFANANGIGNSLPYAYIIGYLNLLEDLSRLTTIVESSCPKTEKKVDLPLLTGEAKKKNCPFKVVVPFIVGKISFSCEDYDIEVGEGIVINYGGNFSTHESTLAIGAGLGADLPGVELGAKEQFYIVFDSDNVPTDVGMKMEAGAESSVGPLMVESKTGYTMGLNSGWNFNTNALGLSSDLL